MNTATYKKIQYRLLRQRKQTLTSQNSIRTKNELLKKRVFCLTTRQKFACPTHQLKLEKRKLMKIHSVYLIHEDSEQILNKAVNQKTNLREKSKDLKTKTKSSSPKSNQPKSNKLKSKQTSK